KPEMRTIEQPNIEGCSASNTRIDTIEHEIYIAGQPARSARLLHGQRGPQLGGTHLVARQQYGQHAQEAQGVDIAIQTPEGITIQLMPQAPASIGQRPQQQERTSQKQGRYEQPVRLYDIGKAQQQDS